MCLFIFLELQSKFIGPFTLSQLFVIQYSKCRFVYFIVSVICFNGFNVVAEILEDLQPKIADVLFCNAGAFIRNVVINYELGKVVGDSPHRVGLKLPHGWVYAQGITHYEMDDQVRLLLAGHDGTGKLAVALQISETPFSY